MPISRAGLKNSNSKTHIIVRLSDITSKKGKKSLFCVFLGCFWACVGQFHEKILRIVRARKWRVSFRVGHFEFPFTKSFFLLRLNENKQPNHMRYYLFLQYGWFLQNLGKDFVQINMHTTVNLSLFEKYRQVVWKTERAFKIFYLPIIFIEYLVQLFSSELSLQSW